MDRVFRWFQCHDSQVRESAGLSLTNLNRIFTDSQHSIGPGSQASVKCWYLILGCLRILGQRPADERRGRETGRTIPKKLPGDWYEKPLSRKAPQGQLTTGWTPHH